MRIADLDLLACPACLKPLELEPRADRAAPPGLDPKTLCWEGALRCEGCGAVYPLLEGVACPAVLNSQWLVPLKEMESRLAVSMRMTQELSRKGEGEGRRGETGYGELYEKQAATTRKTMDALFKAALEEIDFEPSPLILDLGAGNCVTSDAFAQRGARVVAMDSDLPLLRHLCFESIDAIPPESWRHPVSGHVFHFKSPDPLENYLTRVFGNIERLPFPPAAFDVVFCRSVLHHLDDHGRAMAEMMRVLRPGGRIIMCSEPIRSSLEREEDCWDSGEGGGCAYHEIGMNDRVWPLAHYLAPMRPFVRGIAVHTWTHPASPRLAARLPFLAKWLSRRIGPGALVSGWKLNALRFCSASINIYARRNDRAAQQPLPAAKLDASHPGEELKSLVELYRVAPGEIEAGVQDLPRKRRAVADLRRRLLGRFAPPPSALNPGKASIAELERGWLQALEKDGRLGRLISREAECILSTRSGRSAIAEPGGDNSRAGGGVSGAPLTLTAAAARVNSSPSRLDVFVNERPCGCIDLTEPGWREASFALPEGVGPVVTVLLRPAGRGGRDSPEKQEIESESSHRDDAESSGFQEPQQEPRVLVGELSIRRGR